MVFLHLDLINHVMGNVRGVTSVTLTNLWLWGNQMTCCQIIKKNLVKHTVGSEQISVAAASFFYENIVCSR